MAGRRVFSLVFPVRGFLAAGAARTSPGPPSQLQEVTPQLQISSLHHVTQHVQNKQVQLLSLRISEG